MVLRCITVYKFNLRKRFKRLTKHAQSIMMNLSVSGCRFYGTHKSVKGANRTFGQFLPEFSHTLAGRL